MPSEGPLIVASTHRSYLDPVALGAFLPRIFNFMAKSELFEKRSVAAFITAFGAFPVNRESVRGSTFRTAIKLLRNNGAIIIFPEGGIVESIGEQGFKGGIGMLARRTGSPILPVYLAGKSAAIRQNRPPEVDGTVGLRASAVLEGIIVSVRENRKVELAELYD